MNTYFLSSTNAHTSAHRLDRHKHTHSGTHARLRTHSRSDLLELVLTGLDQILRLLDLRTDHLVSEESIANDGLILRRRLTAMFALKVQLPVFKLLLDIVLQDRQISENEEEYSMHAISRAIHLMDEDVPSLRPK